LSRNLDQPETTVSQEKLTNNVRIFAVLVLSDGMEDGFVGVGYTFLAGLFFMYFSLKSRVRAGIPPTKVKITVKICCSTGMIVTMVLAVR
jgi:hypothetical protein